MKEVMPPARMPRMACNNWRHEASSAPLPLLSSSDAAPLSEPARARPSRPTVASSKSPTRLSMPHCALMPWSNTTNNWHQTSLSKSTPAWRNFGIASKRFSMRRSSCLLKHSRTETPCPTALMPVDPEASVMVISVCTLTELGDRGGASVSTWQRTRCASPPPSCGTRSSRESSPLANITCARVPLGSAADTSSHELSTTSGTESQVRIAVGLGGKWPRWSCQPTLPSGAGGAASGKIAHCMRASGSARRPARLRWRSRYASTCCWGSKKVVPPGARTEARRAHLEAGLSMAAQGSCNARGTSVREDGAEPKPISR
mmetsp:Transcript_9015/g.25861  ORF Transcript_9015/g.25861 Transcript_9015/m.25861 type:complete len:316 (-) Transcript_9015:503-1450(-)